jgi:hypothetical protein
VDTFGDGGPGLPEVYDRVLDSSTFLANDASEDENVGVAFAPAASQYLVAWVHKSGSNYQIVGQRLDASGLPTGGRFNICDENSPGHPCGATVRRWTRVVYNPSKQRFLVVWQEGENTAADIWGREVDTAGNPQDEPFGIAVTGSAQEVPNAVCDNTNYFVVWQDKRNSSQYDIYGARLEPRVGQPPRVTERPIARSGSDAEIMPDVAANPNSTSGRFLVVYLRTIGSYQEGWRNFLDSSGNPGTAAQLYVPTDSLSAVAVEGEQHNQRFRVVFNRSNNSNPYSGVVDATGNVVVAWQLIGDLLKFKNAALGLALVDDSLDYFLVAWENSNDNQWYARFLPIDIQVDDTYPTAYFYGSSPGAHADNNNNSQPALACDTANKRCVMARWVENDDIMVGLVFWY